MTIITVYIGYCRHCKSCIESRGKERLKTKALRRPLKTVTGADVSDTGLLGQTVPSTGHDREGPITDGGQPS